MIKYDLLYVPRIGQTQSFSSNSDAISLEVKKLILHSKNGDKILVDDIQAHGTGGITRRLNPIAITIQKAQTCQTIQPDYYTYQETENSKIETTRYLDNNSQLFKNNESLVFKGYKVQCNDTQFLVEVKKNSKKTFWEKHYYPSGKLKAEYNFESNDTIGTATSFYESGKIKSVGNLIAKNISIIEDCVGFVFEGASFADTHLIDSFLFHNYAPIGQWKGYYENGKVTLECTLNLYKYGQIPLKEGDPIFDIWNNRTKILASIKEAIKSKDEYFKPKLTGSFKLYDRQGQIINEQNFKD